MLHHEHLANDLETSEGVVPLSDSLLLLFDVTSAVLLHLTLQFTRVLL